jgi:AcrR family transcriptional regulator
VTQQVAAPASGLRQRKKQRTREELIEAAIRLFLAQGYEKTTVDQIADAVEVSQRTFFRYFASKEDVAFGAVAAAEELFHQELCRRPEGEEPLAALRAAMRTVNAELCAEESTFVDAALHLRLLRLVEETPVLLARQLRRAEELEDRIAAELARRAGVDMAVDPRPRLVTAAFGAACRVASRAWSRSDEANAQEMVRLLEEHLDLLLPSLQGDWAAGGEPR